MDTHNCIQCGDIIEIHDPVQRIMFRCFKCQVQYRINMTEEERKVQENARKYNRFRNRQ